MTSRSGVDEEDVAQVKDLVDATMNEEDDAKEEVPAKGAYMPDFVSNPTTDEISVANPLTGKVASYQKKATE